MSLDAPVSQSLHFSSRSGKRTSLTQTLPSFHPSPLMALPQSPARPWLTLARGRLRVGLLVVQALAVHRDAAVAVEFFSLGRGCLVHRPAVGSLLVLLAAVPPGARGQTQPQGGWGGGEHWLKHLMCEPGAQWAPNYHPHHGAFLCIAARAYTESVVRAEGRPGLGTHCKGSIHAPGMNDT